MDARDTQLGDTELKKELAATLNARRDLGEDYESALVDSFLEKVDQRIDSVVDRRVRRQVAEQQMVVARGSRSPDRSSDTWGERYGFGVVSLVAAIPLSGIGGGVAELPGLFVTWAGIVGVNVAWALRNSPTLGRRRGAKGESEWEERPGEICAGTAAPPCDGGRDDGGPREGRGPGRNRAGASVASMEVREPLRRSLAPFRRRPERGAAPALPTSTNVPDPC